MESYQGLIKNLMKMLKALQYHEQGRNQNSFVFWGERGFES